MSAGEAWIGPPGLPTSDDEACARHLEMARWPEGFRCTVCSAFGEPFRFANRPGVLRCRECRADTSITAGTIMEGSHLPLFVWGYARHLVATQPGLSAAQLQRQLGLTRYATALRLLRKLRAVGLTPRGPAPPRAERRSSRRSR